MYIILSSVVILLFIFTPFEAVRRFVCFVVCLASVHTRFFLLISCSWSVMLLFWLTVLKSVYYRLDWFLYH